MLLKARICANHNVYRPVLYIPDRFLSLISYFPCVRFIFDNNIEIVITVVCVGAIGKGAEKKILRGEVTRERRNRLTNSRFLCIELSSIYGFRRRAQRGKGVGYQNHLVGAV